MVPTSLAPPLPTYFNFPPSALPFAPRFSSFSPPCYPTLGCSLRNSVRAEGGRAIADALQGQYTLKKLNLGCAYIAQRPCSVPLSHRHPVKHVRLEQVERAARRWRGRCGERVEFGGGGGGD